MDDPFAAARDRDVGKKYWNANNKESPSTTPMRQVGGHIVRSKSNIDIERN